MSMNDQALDLTQQIKQRVNSSFSSFNIARRHMENAKTHEEKVAAWSQALAEYVKTVTSLKNLAYQKNRETWATALLNEQKNSKILNYLFQAHNTDKHGVIEITSEEPQSISIGGLFRLAGDSSLTIIGDLNLITSTPNGQQTRYHISNKKWVTKNGVLVESNSSSDIPIRSIPEYLALKPVLNRNVQYDVPVTPTHPEQQASYMLQFTHNWLDKKIKEI